MPANANTRHAVARSTGATTLANKAEEGWTLVCLNHGSENPQTSRGAVWKAAAHPEAWCPKCKAIAAGKGEKITDGLLPIPTPTKKAAPKKPATKAAATTSKGKVA
jgi:hypothetical protein